MAQAVGAHSYYDEPIATGGNREDLSDMCWDVSPADTPFITAIRKNKATGVLHSWLTDTLGTGAGTSRIEGLDAVAADPTSRARLTNYTEILTKHSVVTGTQEASLKGGGIKSEMAYQIPRRIRELKTHIETACIGISNLRVAGDDTHARELGSFDSFIGTGSAGVEFAAATSAAATGDGTDLPTKTGTDRALTETIFSGALQALYTASGGNQNITAFMPAKQKGVVSTFTASSTRYVTTDDKKLVASIDVYDGDFHTVKCVPDRFCVAGSVYLVDPEYVALSELRPIQTRDLAILGDSYRKQVIWEGTLEVSDPAAHNHIFDLT